MENLLFSVNRVLPFFLLVLAGGFIGRRKLVPEEFFRLANAFTFKVAIPVNLFCTIAFPEAAEPPQPAFLAYIGGATLLTFAVTWIVCELVIKDKGMIGTMVQGGLRGNFVLLGVPIAEAAGGPAAAQTAAFAMLVVIPLYNALSVVALSVRSYQPGKPSLRGILSGIGKNPLIWAILLALPFSVFQIRLPALLETTFDYIGRCGTPLGLLSIGGLFRWKDATARLKPALWATLTKVVLQPLLWLPIAYGLGFGGVELLVMLALFAAPGAISAYPMTVEMKGDGPLASNILILTTFLSSFVLALGLYILRAGGIL